MAKVTWLGEDELHGGGAGPSFTTAFGIKFPKGEAVEVADKDTIRRAEGNRFFHVAKAVKPEPQEELPAVPDAIEAAPDQPDIDNMTVIQLREVADARGVKHSGLNKAELQDALRG
jgi:hypothetical protein